MIVNIQITMIRILITFVLSFLFGIWRQRSRKPVGFGTFIFVAVGSCALAITAINLAGEGGSPLALLGAIVTGIGFLGAGALIKTSEKIFGFTTAATIWLFAIFGLITGVGEYLVGLLVYVLIMIVTFYDNYLERKGAGSYQRRMVITANKIIQEKELKEILMQYTTNYKISNVYVDKKNEKIRFTYQIEGTKEQINKIPRKLFEKDWFEDCNVEST